MRSSLRASAATQTRGLAHFSIEGFTCALHFDAPATRDATEKSIGQFYRIKDGSAAHGSDITFRLYQRAAADLPMSRSDPQRVTIVAYPTWTEVGERWWADDWMVVQHAAAQTTYRVHHAWGLVDIYAPDLGTLVPSFVRALRLVLGSYLAAGGHAALHASALVVDGKAVAFVGGQCAGKTTLLLDVIRRRGAVLALDKLWLKPEGHRVHCIGEPGSLGLGPGTARRFGLFLDHFTQQVRSVPEAGLWALNAPRLKARIAPSVAAQAMPFDCNGPYPLAAVCFPAVGPGLPTRFALLDVATAQDQLEAAFLPGSRPFAPDWLALGPPADERSNVAAVLRALRTADNIRYCRVSFGDESPFDELPELREIFNG